MGIRLDWEIESEQEHLYSSGEDPAAARARRVARLRFLLVIVGLLFLVGVVVFAVNRRLEDIDRYYETLLTDAVQAEVTALRIGDERAYMNFQHQGNLDWAAAQAEQFDQYQQLLREHDALLTGTVRAVEVDGRRGRVQVEEIIDGVPYSRVWFYWRFDEPPEGSDAPRQSGWLHVPLDSTFWGVPGSYSGDYVTIRYLGVDDPLAVELGVRLERWLRLGCERLLCTQIPRVNVQIEPDPGLTVSWAANDIWTLRVPSPYTGRTRLDTPFNIDLQLEVANLLADRLIALVSDNLAPVYPADAYYFRQSFLSWLVGGFVEINTNTLLINSMAQVYGAGMPAQFLRGLTPDASVGVLPGVLGVPSLADASLDWRDFLTWRLALEDDLIARRDEASFLRLYDTRDETVRLTAVQRYDANLPPEQRIVIDVRLSSAADSTAQLNATVQVGSGDSARQELVLFRLVDNNWLRAN